MHNVKCRFCNNYKNSWCEKKFNSPDPDIIRHCPHFVQLTNGDRIRAMTDDEMADFLCNNTECGSCRFGSWTGCEVREWLKQHVEKE